MKAAILYKKGETPRYGDIEDPIARNDDEIVITITAASVKNIDKAKANGSHYSSKNTLLQPEVVGIDGVGVLNDGTKVYASGIKGMIAERALINRNYIVKLPVNLDDVTAAALPNAALGACGAIQFRAKMQVGQTVLINGATGVTGRIAIQMAKYYGAKKVIATGRNAEALNSLLQIGADEVISLKDADEEIVAKIKAIHKVTPIDAVIDYIWGHPAELILNSLLGEGSPTNKVRFVTVGGMAGDKIQLSSAVLRSSDIEILGSGFGSISPEDMKQLYKEVLPKIFQLAADGKLKIETVTAGLKDVESAWNAEIPVGKRLVIVPTQAFQ